MEKHGNKDSCLKHVHYGRSKLFFFFNSLPSRISFVAAVAVNVDGHEFDQQFIFFSINVNHYVLQPLI